MGGRNRSCRCVAAIILSAFDDCHEWVLVDGTQDSILSSTNPFCFQETTQNRGVSHLTEKRHTPGSPRESSDRMDLLSPRFTTIAADRFKTKLLESKCPDRRVSIGRAVYRRGRRRATAPGARRAPPTAGPDDVLPGTARARLTVVSRLPQVRPEPTCLATAAEAGWGWRFLPHAESC